jgi:hypothetical protein
MYKKSMLAAVSALSVVTFVSGCSSETEKPQAPTAAETPREVSKMEAPMEAKPSLVEYKDEVLEFRYLYPGEAAAVPALAKQLDEDRETKKAQALKEAQEQAVDAKKHDFPVRAHLFSQQWEKVTKLPRFLSLSSSIDTYTGGAHGMMVFDTMVWDYQAQKALKPLDLFTSARAFDDAISQSFCSAINAAKKAKDIEPNTDPDGTFEVCPKASEQTVWLGSSNGETFDRLTIGITAYVVGPYSEGSYDIDVPINTALVRAVKPEYAAFVRAKR